ncbi:MAG: hypothetical protein JW801_12070 [Bacteroidales bacterium]|nr:hypothetical protein [Bacteroidales bacterium]
MKKDLFLLFILIAIGQYASAQNDKIQKQKINFYWNNFDQTYAGFPIIDEGGLKTSREQYLDESGSITFVVNTYKIVNNSEESKFLDIGIELDSKADYSIEFSAKVKGDPNKLNLFSFAEWNSTKRMVFQFNEVGYGFGMVDGEFHPVIQAKPVSRLSSDDYNEYTISRLGDSLYFYMNSTLIDAVGNAKSFGNLMSFDILPHTEIELKRFSLAYYYRLIPGQDSEEDYKDLNNLATKVPLDNSAWFTILSQSMEEFTISDVTRWKWEDAGGLVSEIKNGKLHIENHSGSSVAVWTEKALDMTKNFEVQVMMRCLSSQSQSVNSFFWGGNADERYCFGFNDAGLVKAYTDAFFSFETFFDFTSTGYADLCGSQDNQILIIRKYKDYYVFMLNKTVINISKVIPLKGDRIGFQIADGAEIEVDQIKISYFE